ncbi:mRNA turnover and ribosome assembly protein [Podospora conica]|nr:mRNA turnover and ribosome assembly protein [Schizothecium conicum]
MPKSKRARTFHLTQVTKKTREQKEQLFTNIRECVPKYNYCFVFSIDNMRNSYLKEIRRELNDCRLFFGKTKLTARALGATPEESQADGIHRLTRYLSGSVGLLFTDRAPESIISYFSTLTQVDFARAGTRATRTVVVPPGPLMSTGGEVPAEDDVPVAHTLEPEFRKLGLPTRMVSGKVVLGADEETGAGYTVCREGEVLDSRQTRVLKLFSICTAEFRVQLMAYWTKETGEVTELAEPVEGAAAAEGDEMSEDE